MLRILVLIVILFSGILVSAFGQVNVAVYNDEGAWLDGVIAFEKFLDWKGLTHERVNASDINGNVLDGKYTAVYFPGGYAYDYKRKLTARGEQHIRDLVSNGGGYIGICAGAFFAADRVDWEGGSYPYTLGLFHGTARGALDVIIPWPGWTMTSINISPGHPITAGKQQSYRTLYYGGPSFHADPGTLVDTLATWASDAETPAMIAFLYGTGRVLLFGPHPEIEENDSRDGTAFAGDLSDPESEWGLLWSSMDWLLKRAVTDTTVTGAIEVAAPSRTDIITVFPNPAQESMTVTLTQSELHTGRLTLVDVLGRACLLIHDGRITQGTTRFHAQLRGLGSEPLPAGIYHVVLQTDEGVRQVSVVVR